MIISGSRWLYRICSVTVCRTHIMLGHEWQMIECQRLCSAQTGARIHPTLSRFNPELIQPSMDLMVFNGSQLTGLSYDAKGTGIYSYRSGIEG